VDITESHGIPEPALLSVSKIVRSESYKVFYFENSFCCAIEHFGPTTLLLARRKTPSKYPNVGIRRPLLLVRHEERHWGNLALWLHKCLQSQCTTWVPTAEDEPYYDAEPVEAKLISSLFKSIFYELRMTSEHLDYLLGCIRLTFIAIDKHWAKN
jgi:hypothetical protein